MKEEKQLTVDELIKLLEKQHKDALVWVEGCDCVAEAVSIVYDEFDNSVLIQRA